jgi:hypothetical protein
MPRRCGWASIRSRYFLTTFWPSNNTVTVAFSSNILSGLTTFPAPPSQKMSQISSDKRLLSDIVCFGTRRNEFFKNTRSINCAIFCADEKKKVFVLASFGHSYGTDLLYSLPSSASLYISGTYGFLAGVSAPSSTSLAYTLTTYARAPMNATTIPMLNIQ